jgi:hypothetical protein
MKTTNTETKKNSKALELVKLVWDNEKTGSYRKINSLMQETLKLAIRANLDFDKNDFENIYNKFKGRHWFLANENGKGIGDMFYRHACESGNTSAAQSYESFYDFKPFITEKGHRLYPRYELVGNSRYYRVTGFDFDTKRVHLVSLDASGPGGKGKRVHKLHDFDNKEWNEFRKTVTENQ